MAEIKICGLFRDEDIEAVNFALPDFVGFIVNFPISHRSLTVEKLRALKKNLSPKIKAVGVFVNENIDTIRSLLNDGTIDYAQLHGDEDDGYVAELKRGARGGIIKSFVFGEANFSPAKINACPADFVLIDSGRGGGKLLDGSAFRGINRKLFLAGGLTPENIGGAIEKYSPYAVDISSGVETDGKKDFEKIVRAVNAARRG